MHAARRGLCNASKKPLPVFVNSFTNLGSPGGTTVSCSFVGGDLTVGNYVYAVLANSAGVGPPWTMPTGWTQVGGTGGSACFLTFCYKKVAPGDPGTSGGGSVTFTTSAGSDLALAILQYSSAADPTVLPTFSTGSSTNPSAPSVTPSGSNYLWIAAFTDQHPRDVTVGPAGLTSRAHNFSGINAMVAVYEGTTSSGVATGAATPTISASDLWIGMSTLI
jgi:hypothetical protein